jgi:hypothetical protein
VKSIKARANALRAGVLFSAGLLLLFSCSREGQKGGVSIGDTAYHRLPPVERERCVSEIVASQRELFGIIEDNSREIREIERKLARETARIERLAPTLAAISPDEWRAISLEATRRLEDAGLPKAGSAERLGQIMDLSPRIRRAYEKYVEAFDELGSSGVRK